MHVIYKIQNIVNKKMYIGQTNNPNRRKKRHFSELNCLSHKNTHLQKSWNKYGSNNFTFEIIDKANSFEEILEKEKFWINLYKTIDRKFGYNLTDGGRAPVFSKETIKKLSNFQKGRKKSEEHKRKISKASKGKIISDKQKKYFSDLYKERYKNGELPYLKPTFLSGKTHGMYGKTHSEEARKKISASKAGKTYEEIFGEEKAIKIKKEISKRFSGKSHPCFRNIDATYIKKLIDEGKMIKDIKKIVSSNYQTISKRFKDFYGISISEYTNSIGLTKNGARIKK
jgi:group I intron endonuclease